MGIDWPSGLLAKTSGDPRQVGKLKFKRKGDGDSFRFPNLKQFSARKVTKKKGFVKLPKVGEIAFRMSRPLVGKIKNAAVKRELDGWYTSFGL